MEEGLSSVEKFNEAATTIFGGEKVVDGVMMERVQE
jgi:hypothetical protein